MFNLKYWLNLAINPQDYIWIEATLIKETSKAILIEFDNKEIWFPKAWIMRINRNKDNSSLRIEISQYHWAKKVQ
ncbi:MAG: hypothetical protein ISS45_13825 [Candidatus Omnitrophica bacterium]|nr:hypothetical protein [Candidatus Omnitrophota bacterium]